MRGRDLELAFESGDGVFEPMVGTPSRGRSGEDDAWVTGADDLDGRDCLREVSRAVVALLAEVVVGVEIGFVAEFDGQDRAGADLEGISGFVRG